MTTSRRPLGFWSATALVVGSMIGSGTFLLPATLAPYGAASLIGWGVTLCGALLLALTFARLARRWPQTGGPYVFARNAFGELPGFMVAWSYWISMWCAIAAIAVAFAGSVGAIFPALTATPLRAAGCSLAALWLCAAVNLAGLREAGRMQLLTTVLKVVPLLLFGLVALWFVDAGHYRPFNPSGQPLGGVAAATVALTLWAMIGLEAATVPAESVQDAPRTVARATVAGTAIAGIATVLACTVVLGLLPAETLARSSAPMADAAAALWGPAAGVLLALVMAVSCVGALNGWTLLAAQLPLAAARDGVLPRAFARENRRGAPAFGILVSGVLASVLVISNYHRSLVDLFTFSVLLSTAATLLPYLAGAAAWLWRGSGGASRLAAAGALAFSLYALGGIGAEALLWGAGLVVAGLPVYFRQRRK
ncbi:amino acid permease [Stenotrophomonas mori]|uniref:Arginine/agmatine antiporter n=1 Tax=Stenotrophomonas mori TaxID=2871096 RepID=A0ABT0SEA2_9GAMM|nr:amino acid permease [Stenotrophomonas mori]MCL7713637.1 amino acid permease [Stenotrophomonas mori]